MTDTWTDWQVTATTTRNNRHDMDVTLRSYAEGAYDALAKAGKLK